MTNDTTNTGGASIVFDDWRTIAFAVFMALVGYSVMVTVPVLSTALVQSLSFTAEQVGRVWGNVRDLGSGGRGPPNRDAVPTECLGAL